MPVPHALPPVHLGILVPVDPDTPHEVIGWDDVAELVPVLVGALGCEYLDTGLTLTGKTETLRVYADGATPRRAPMNKRATAIARALAHSTDLVVCGPAAFVGGDLDATGLTPGAYTWLDGAITAITSLHLRDQ